MVNLTALADGLAPAKLSKTEREEYRALMESFGWSIVQKTGGIFLVSDKIGTERMRMADKAAVERGVLIMLRDLSITGTTGDETDDRDADDRDGSDDQAIPSLEDQLSEISDNGGLPDTTLGQMIADFGPFLYKTDGVAYAPADYAQIRARVKSNPPGNDPAEWTLEQSAARHAFNLKSRWDKTARAAYREKHGLAAPTPQPRERTDGERNTAVKASAVPASDRAFLARLATFDPASTVAGVARMLIPIGSVKRPIASDAARIMAHTLAGRSLLSFYGRRAPFIPSAVKVVVAAVKETVKSIPSRVVEDAIESAADAERTIYILIIGQRYEQSILKESRLRERFALVQDAYLCAIVAPDGSVQRLAMPERLTAIPVPVPVPTVDNSPTIAQSLIDATTAQVDPASTVNVIAPGEGSGILASDAARQEIAA